MAENKRAMSKSAVMQKLAEETGLSKKQVAEVFEALAGLIKQELGKKGPGMFTLPGLAKLRLKKKPATKGGTKPDPFHPGQMMTVKPKPASNTVRIRPLKGLNELVK